MKLTEVFELLEQRDPQTLYVIGDSHGVAITGGNIQNLARKDVGVDQIAAQAQGVPDNSVVIYSGGANNHTENGIVVASKINKQIKRLKQRGCFVILVSYPMIDLQSTKPSALPNDGRFNKGLLLATDTTGAPVEVTKEELATAQSNGTITAPLEDRLPLNIVYRNAGYNNNYNRVREQIRRNNDADETLLLKTINPQDPQATHSMPNEYSGVANSARQMARTEINRRKNTDFPIGTDIPTGETFSDGAGFGFAGDLFGIFGSAFGREEEIPDNDILTYDKDGNPMDGSGNPIDNADQPQGAQVNVGDLSKGLINYIKTKEGYGVKIDPNNPRSDVKAYDDFKQYSIGFGTKARSRTETLTYAQAEQRLIATVKRFRTGVLQQRDQYGYNWNSGAVDALTSFAYNLGLGKIAQLTNNGRRSNNEIARKILEYNQAGGRRLAGLVQRRREESASFIKAQTREELAFKPGAGTTTRA